MTTREVSSAPAVRAALLSAALLAGLPGCAAPAANLPAPAPAFTLADADGRPVRGPSRAAAGVTVVEFFATWCPACRGHVETLNSLADEGVPVVAVALGGRFGNPPAPDADTVRRFVAEHGVRYPVALSDGRVPEAYARAAGAELHFIPMTFVVDPAGRITACHVGGAGRDALQRDIRAAAAPDRPATPGTPARTVADDGRDSHCRDGVCPLPGK